VDANILVEYQLTFKMNMTCSSQILAFIYKILWCQNPQGYKLKKKKKTQNTQSDPTENYSNFSETVLAVA
jgi:hypothetical protein